MKTHETTCSWVFHRDIQQAHRQVKITYQTAYQSHKNYGALGAIKCPKMC